MSGNENLRKGLNINELLSRKITLEQLKECREAFDMYDNDKDEIITTAELVLALRALGYNSNKVVVEKIKEMDIDSDDGVGKLKFQDFLNFVVTSIRYAYTKDDMLTDFRHIDANNDGKITKLELQNYLESLKIPFSAEEIEEIVNAADLNRDGSIDYNEFVIMMSPKDKMAL